MSFRLTELYAELAVKGGPTVDAALAGVRREMIKTQRIAKALGGEMGEGLGIASELFRRSTQRNLEPQLLRMQANLLAATGKMRGWSREQGLAVASAVAFENALGKMSFRISEVQGHMEGITRQAKFMFAGLTGGALGMTAAASPVLFKTLIDSFGWLSAEIGRGFVPYVAEAARMVQSLARWFGTLSDVTRDNIAKWTLLGIAFSGVVVAGGLLLSTVGSILTGIKSLVDLYILWAARSRAVVAGHLAEAEAANVAAAAETRLAAARGQAAGAGAAGAAGGAVGGGIAGSVLAGVGIGAAIYGIFKILDLMKEGIAGFVKPERNISDNGAVNRLFGATRAMTRSTFLGEAFSDWFEKKLGIDQAGANPDQNKLLLSLNRPIMMTGIADAWKQAQMGALKGFGPEGEQLKVQQQMLQELIRSNGYLSELTPQAVGPN